MLGTPYHTEQKAQGRNRKTVLDFYDTPHILDQQLR